MDKDAGLENLRQENAWLKALLERHGIDWESETPQAYGQEDTELAGSAASASTSSGNSAPSMSTEEKVALFRGLFQGRPDVFARRWESNRGKSGYAPACANEWVDEVCGKPRVKCAECANRHLLPITDRVLFDHLSGKHVVGMYPLLDGDTCRFLAVDYDEGEWKDDASSFVETCRRNSGRFSFSRDDENITIRSSWTSVRVLKYQRTCRDQLSKAERRGACRSVS